MKNGLTGQVLEQGHPGFQTAYERALAQDLDGSRINGQGHIRNARNAETNSVSRRHSARSRRATNVNKPRETGRVWRARPTASHVTRSPLACPNDPDL